MNYIHSSSIQQYKIYPFRSKPIDFISQHDSYHKLIKQRVEAVSALDSPYSELLLKNYQKEKMMLFVMKWNEQLKKTFKKHICNLLSILE